MVTVLRLCHTVLASSPDPSQDAASSLRQDTSKPSPSPSVQTQRSAVIKKPKQSPAMAGKQTSHTNPSPSVLSPKSSKKPSKGQAKSSPASRRRKGDVDANAPKKPSNAFFWFCQEHRGSFEDRFRGEGVAGQHSLTKILAQKWAETPTEDKQVSDRQPYVYLCDFVHHWQYCC